jgi:hypothetical protein
MVVTRLFPFDQKNNFVYRTRKLSKCGFPSVSTDVTRIVYKCAVANNERDIFSYKTQMAGKYLIGSKERHPENEKVFRWFIESN